MYILTAIKNINNVTKYAMKYILCMFNSFGY